VVKAVFSREELYEDSSIRTFSNCAEQVAFPLGGIGTGNVSIGARGQLKDWEIFNRPGKDVTLPFTFFALRVQAESNEPVVRVLEGKMNPPYHASGGLYPSTLAGLPSMEKTCLKGEYPICHIDFMDPSVPLDISLQAYTPFIPLNPEDSGIPTAIFKFRLKNTSSKKVNVSLIGSIFNAVGFDVNSLGQNVNTYRKEDGFSGLYLSSNKFTPEELPFGNMTFVTTSDSTTVKTSWLRSGWFDTLQDFWDDFTDDGLLIDNTYDEPSSKMKSDVGSLGVVYTLQPGQEEEVLFILSWYFPNRPYAWRSTCECGDGCEITQNYYATMFSDSWDVTKYVLDNYDRLESDTFLFHDAFFSSTLPGYVLDAVSSQMSIIRSTTCMWFADGRFYGWEGCHGRDGCCHGTCTHVWNYAQSLAFLFPSLERQMRKINFLDQTDESGGMAFRTNLPLSKDIWKGRAADGQMGTIMRLYREWKISGDNDFLRELWPNVKLALEYAWEHWDKDLVNTIKKRMGTDFAGAIGVDPSDTKENEDNDE
jgi:non-lysosomal glucosylceramidase